MRDEDEQIALELGVAQTSAELLDVDEATRQLKKDHRRAMPERRAADTMERADGSRRYRNRQGIHSE